jgi:Flp pilus assembly protein TadD
MIDINSLLQEAMKHCQSGNLYEAEKLYLTILKEIPDHAEAYNNLGGVFYGSGRVDEAIVSYQRAISIKPDFAGAYYNLGILYEEQDRFDTAISNYMHAVRFNPEHAMAYNNLGNVFKKQGRIKEAIESYTSAILIEPDNADIHLNRSIALLLSGSYKEGWEEYEWRKKIIEYPEYVFTKPQWNGGPLDNRTVLVYEEQGFGDIFQFARYLPLLKAQSVHVILACHKELFPVLKGCKGIDEIIELAAINTASIKYDFHVSLMSLPLLFNTRLTTIPADVPYITAEPDLTEKWRIRLGRDQNFKIGIVWAGGLLNSKDKERSRSCPFEEFIPLMNISGLTFYSLQKGIWADQADKPPRDITLVNLDRELNDFADTAAVIEKLDLIISIDTSVAHLAGAMARPVWTLLSFSPDWRWLLEKEDSPWYPTMRLFRQPEPGNWKAVIKSVTEELRRLPGKTP